MKWGFQSNCRFFHQQKLVFFFIDLSPQSSHWRAFHRMLQVRYKSPGECVQVHHQTARLRPKTAHPGDCRGIYPSSQQVQ
ncbi:hypothetical protein EMIT047CA2_160045 [Pseudomonas soli]